MIHQERDIIKIGGEGKGQKCTLSFLVFVYTFRKQQDGTIRHRIFHTGEVRNVYKQLMLAIIALIGVLAPCVVEMNISHTYVQETTHYIDLRLEHVEQEPCEAAQRTLGKPPKANAGKVIENVCHQPDDEYTDGIKTEKRRTHLFYAREAGGMPNQPNFPV